MTVVANNKSANLHVHVHVCHTCACTWHVPSVVHTVSHSLLRSSACNKLYLKYCYSHSIVRTCPTKNESAAKSVFVPRSCQRTRSLQNVVLGIYFFQHEFQQAIRYWRKKQLVGSKKNLTIRYRQQGRKVDESWPHVGYSIHPSKSGVHNSFEFVSPTAYKQWQAPVLPEFLGRPFIYVNNIGYSRFHGLVVV